MLRAWEEGRERGTEGEGKGTHLDCPGEEGRGGKSWPGVSLPVSDVVVLSVVVVVVLRPGKCYCHWHCLGTNTHYPSQGLPRHCTSRCVAGVGGAVPGGAGPAGGGAKATQDTEGQSPRPPRSRPRMNLGRRNVLRSSPARRRGGAGGTGRSLARRRRPMALRDTSPPEPPLSLHQHVKPPLY